MISAPISELRTHDAVQDVDRWPGGPAFFPRRFRKRPQLRVQLLSKMPLDNHALRAGDQAPPQVSFGQVEIDPFMGVGTNGHALLLVNCAQIPVRTAGPAGITAAMPALLRIFHLSLRCRRASAADVTRVFSLRCGIINLHSCQ